jgi:manganese/zinc/iron transport system permease protein
MEDARLSLRVNWVTMLEFDYTLGIVMAGTAIIGIVAGALGCFALLRKQSLLGDTISHAALPGVALAFLITGSKAPWILLAGAIIAGWIGTLLIGSIIRHTRIKEDSAMGIILSVFFGFGLVLLTVIQNKFPTASQAGLDKFLFGSASTLVQRDVIMMSALGTVTLFVLLLLWKEFKVLSFDPDFATTMGFPTRMLDIILMTLIVIAISIGLQTVGVVLMSAMLVAPAAGARQWTNRLDLMVLLAAGFGAISGLAGTLTSSMMNDLPTGPTITIYLTIIVLFSLLFARQRGLVWQSLQRHRNKRKIQLTTALVTLHRLEESHQPDRHAHDLTALRAFLYGDVTGTMERLVQRGLVRETREHAWLLTDNGKREAQHHLKEVESGFNGQS